MTTRAKAPTGVCDLSVRSASRQPGLVLVVLALALIAIILLFSPGQGVDAKGIAIHATHATRPHTPPHTTSYTPHSASPTPACGTWTIEPSPNEGTMSNVMGSLAVVAADDIWAVGFRRVTLYIEAPLIMHWNGVEWSIVPSDVSEGELTAVDALSATDVWAVGWDDGTHTTLIMHWDGSSWSRIPSPNVGSEQNYLYDVEAISANDVWAVGVYNINNGDNTRTLTMHWDGVEWTIVPSPNPSQDSQGLHSVSVVASNDVWAVGGIGDRSLGLSITLIEHWDGTKWSVVPSPNPGISNWLHQVEMVSSNDGWALGGYSVTSPPSTGARPLIQHWDGVQWSVVPSPNVGQRYVHYFNDIEAVSANDIWTAGYYYSTSYPFALQSLVMHWDGVQWSIVPSPNVGEQTLLGGVGIVDPDEIWVAGWYDTGE